MKLIGFATVILNFIVFLNTFEQSRAATRNRINGVVDKPTLAQQSDGSGQQAPPKPKPLTVDQEAVLLQKPFVVGEMRSEDPGRELNFVFQIQFWKASADQIDAGAWHAQAVIFDKEKLSTFTVYKAKPAMENGVVTLNLDPTDKEKQFFNNNSRDLPITIETLVLKFEAGDMVTLSVQADAGAPKNWLTKANVEDTKYLADFTGSWAAQFPNGKTGKVDLKLDSGRLVGDLLYNHDVGPCTGKVRVVPIGQKQLLVVAGTIDGHTVCPAHSVIRIKSTDTGIVAGYSDYNTEAEETMTLKK